jgi:hypothetical protein
VQENWEARLAEGGEGDRGRESRRVELGRDLSSTGSTPPTHAMSDPLPLASKPLSASSSSSGRAPLLLPSFLQSLPEDSSHTLSSILEQNRQLEDDAREVLPGDIEHCSYDYGYVRQAVYACKTCPSSSDGQRGGFCFACSVSCHGGELARPPAGCG